MGWLYDDRLLWLGIAISSVAVSWALLRTIDDLDAATQTTAIFPPVSSNGNSSGSKRSCVVDQQTEDDVSSADLVTLAKHPTRHISEAAIKILVLRAVNDRQVVKAVETDYADALAGSDGEEQVRFSSAYKARKLMRRYEPNCFAPPPTSQYRRPRHALGELGAGPSGGDAMQEIVDAGAEDTIENLLGDIDTFARESAEAASAAQEEENEQWSTAWLAMDARRNNDNAHGGTIADDVTAQRLPQPRSRLREGSPEEQARRRRRREAIVLNEGNRPLTQQDIIQRRTTRNT